MLDICGLYSFRQIRTFCNSTCMCTKSGPTLLFAFALSLTLRAQKWAVVSRLDFLFSFLNSHRGEKLWQLHLIPRPRLIKYQTLTKLCFIHVNCSVVHCALFTKTYTCFYEKRKTNFQEFSNPSILTEKPITSLTNKDKHCRRGLKWQIFTQSLW